MAVDMHITPMAMHVYLYVELYIGYGRVKQECHKRDRSEKCSHQHFHKSPLYSDNLTSCPQSGQLQYKSRDEYHQYYVQIYTYHAYRPLFYHIILGTTFYSESGQIKIELYN